MIGVAVLGAILARQVAAGTSYGDATGHVFAISAGIARLGVAAAVLLPPILLRASLDRPASGDRVK